jgi:hypothetical protein
MSTVTAELDYIVKDMDLAELGRREIARKSDRLDETLE